MPEDNFYQNCNFQLFAKASKQIPNSLKEVFRFSRSISTLLTFFLSSSNAALSSMLSDSNSVALFLSCRPCRWAISFLPRSIILFRSGYWSKVLLAYSLNSSLGEVTCLELHNHESLKQKWQGYFCKILQHSQQQITDVLCGDDIAVCGFFKVLLQFEELGFVALLCHNTCSQAKDPWELLKPTLGMFFVVVIVVHHLHVGVVFSCVMNLIND